MQAFMADPAKAQAIVKSHGAGLLVLCSDLAEAANYAHDAPGGLAAALKAGKVPGWLERIDIGAPADFQVYRVRRP